MSAEDVPPSEFDGRDFDACEFVQRYRKRLPLTQLQKVLQVHHKSRRQELVELINEKYQDFVSLSLRMQGVERALKPLRGPLEESSELTQSMRERLGSLLEKAQEARQARTKLRTRREALTLYLENAKLLERVRALVDRPVSDQGASKQEETANFLKEHVASENAARDLRRLQLCLGGRPRTRTNTDNATAEGAIPPHVVLSDESLEESFAECRALLAEAAKVEESFVASMQKKLTSLVSAAKACLLSGGSSPDSKASPAQTLEARVSRMELLAIAHVCRALMTLGRAAIVEAVFIQLFIKEALVTAAASCAAGGESVGAGAVDLKPFFDTATVSLLSDDAAVMWFARRLRGEGPAGGTDHGSGLDDALLAVPSLHLASQVVAASVTDYVQSAWPQVFMPAFPDMFAANYGHAQRFLKCAESFMTQSERQRFTQCSSIQDFQKRWKVQVYSSMQGKEAMKKLEAALNADLDPKEGLFGSTPKHSFHGKQCWLAITLKLMQLLQIAWEDWYLDAVFPKMVQLSLELISKHGKLVIGLVPRPEDKAVGGGSPLPGASPPVPTASGWEASASPPTWSPSSAVVRLPRFVADLQLILDEVRTTPEAVRGSLAKHMLGRAQGGERHHEIVVNLLQETSTMIENTLEELGSAIIKQVSAVVVPQFAAIRAIPRSYRMLNKPVPEVASPYVQAATAPIEAFRAIAVQCAAEDVVRSWVSGVIEAVVVEFAQQSEQLVESMKQQEASLRRTAGRAAAGDSQVTDLDKIHIQLCLDIDVFTKTAATMGVIKDSSAGLTQLHEKVSTVWPTYLQHRPAAS